MAKLYGLANQKLCYIQMLQVLLHSNLQTWGKNQRTVGKYEPKLILMIQIDMYDNPVPNNKILDLSAGSGRKHCGKSLVG